MPFFRNMAAMALNVPARQAPGNQLDATVQVIAPRRIDEIPDWGEPDGRVTSRAGEVDRDAGVGERGDAREQAAGGGQEALGHPAQYCRLRAQANRQRPLPHSCCVLSGPLPGSRRAQVLRGPPLRALCRATAPHRPARRGCPGGCSADRQLRHPALLRL